MTKSSKKSGLSKKDMYTAGGLAAVVLGVVGLFFYTANAPKEADVSKKEVSQAKEEVVESAAYFNKNLNFFSTGQPLKANAVYIFFDPRCIHCAALWEASKQVPDQKYNWIPVGLLSNKSVQISMEILANSNPVDLMDKNEAIVKAGGMGIDTKDRGDAYLEKVKKNTLVFQALGFGSVPAILAPNPKGAGFIRHEGALSPAKLKEFIKGSNSLELP